MRLSIGQMVINLGDIESNLNQVNYFLNQALQDKSDIILLPELFLTGFDYKNLTKLSLKMKKYLEILLKHTNNIAICGSLLENVNGEILNTFYCLQNEKIIFKYSKVKLFSVTKEDNYFKSGSKTQPNTFELFGTKFGVAICYELRFPEFFRRAALNGASVMLLPAVWPIERKEHFQILSQARSIENQFFLACSNGVKNSGNWFLAGESAVFDPQGKILVTALDSVSLKTVEIDPNYAKIVRENFPSVTNAYDLNFGD